MKLLSEKLAVCGTVLLLCLLLDQRAEAQRPSRIKFTINDNWKFISGDTPDAAEWQSVNLPHTWNSFDTLDDEPGYRRGVSWYKRELRLDRGLQGKRIFFFFEGVNQVAEVFVNDNLAGKHVGGYTAFSFDVTDLLRFGDTNHISVRVDNRLVKDIPPIDGDFNAYGGVYRDVWLIATDQVRVTTSDVASSSGILITTPNVTAEEATVAVEGSLVNSTSRVRDVQVSNTIIDPAGNIVETLVSKVRAAPGTESVFKQISKRIPKPRLWSPEDPNLYKLRTTIRENRTILDEVSNPLGLRWFRFDAEKGFFLNGRHLKLRGTNRHQDHAGLGNAVPDRLHIRDLEIIKQNGFNFLRLAHYPQDPALLEAADRLGILIWEEIPIVNQIHVSDAFDENARNMLREMIRQHRNHPSIIIWGYMNEVFLPVPKTQEVVQATVRLARELEEICKTEDPTRATAIAFDWGARDLYNSSGLGNITQVVGWNLYHGWYYENFDDLGKFLDDQHRQFPRRPLIVSEYGANGDRRVHSLSPKKFDSSIEWQQMFHEAYLPQIESRAFVAGSAIWNQFDFGSEFRGETIPHINQKGIFTLDRKPKDISFFYKASYSTEPVVHIAARDRTRRSGPRSQTVDVYSNFDRVEMFQNGLSLGTRSVGTGQKASWPVSFVNGRNLMKARASRGQKSITDEIEISFYDPAVTKVIAINCGSHTEVTDDSGTVWQADVGAESRNWRVIDDTSTRVETRQNILGTADDPIYQTMREGPAAYRFDVPDGSYEIEMRFAETKFKEAGQRVFRIAVNGRPVVERLDLAGEAGFMKHLSRKLSAQAIEGRGLLIELVPITNSPIVSGVKLENID